MRLALALAGVLLAACGSRAAPARPVPQAEARAPVVIEQRQCLTEQPPAPREIAFAECGGQWVACLDRASALALAAYLSDLRRYASDAWIACGPDVPPKAKEPPP